MKIKLDENLPASAAQVLSDSGYEVDTVVDEGLAGRDDPTVLAAAKAEGRLLITIDRGFGDIRQYPPGSHAGIVVLRLESQAAPSVLAALHSLTDNHDLADYVGCIAVVRGHLVRVRRP